MEREIDYNGEIADNYERGRSLSPAAIQVWRAAVKSHVPSTGVIVDLGAGTGRFARPLSELAQRAVVAIEPATGMRNSRSDTKCDVKWVAGKAEAIPLATASVGLVWSAFTTHYLDLDQAAAEIARMLRPGGRTLVWHAFPDVFDDLEWFRWFPGARAIDEERMPTAATVQQAFEAAGLSFVARTDHRMPIAPDLASLADRLAHRSISTLRMIPDDEFNDGLTRLRVAAADRDGPGPVTAPNVMLRFDRPA